MDKTFFLACLIDWEADGQVVALSGSADKQEAVEAVEEALKHRIQDFSGYVVPVEYLGRGKE